MQIGNLNASKDNKNSKTKKYVLIGLIVSVVLLFLILTLLIVFSSMKPQKLMLSIDGQTKEFAQDTFVFEEEKVYVSLKDIANLVGYRYYDGGYKEFTQDKTICYLECDDEIVVYESKKDKISKTLNNDKIQYSEFNISAPVKMINNKLYVVSSGLSIGCNLSFLYKQDTNQITINTLSNLYNTYSARVEEGKYINVTGLDENFINKKAILYGMLVVNSNIKGQTKYGVISLDGEKTYLDIKYNDMKFIENLQEFIVKGETKYGVMAKNGAQKIKIDYDEIKLFDNINNLYYVQKNGKKGILDVDGEALGQNLYVEYDEIGVDASLFKSNNIQNSMELFNKCIPVKKGEKWGVFDISGELISNFNWDSLGYVDAQKSSENILLINGIIEGIIVCRDGKYGIIDSEGNLLVGPVFDKIYSETEAGEERYYIQFGNTITELDDYLNQDEAE